MPTLLFPWYTHQDPFHSLNNSSLSISESLSSLMPCFILIILAFSIQKFRAKVLSIPHRSYYQLPSIFHLFITGYYISSLYKLFTCCVYHEYYSQKEEKKKETESEIEKRKKKKEKRKKKKEKRKKKKKKTMSMTHLMCPRSHAFRHFRAGPSRRCVQQRKKKERQKGGGGKHTKVSQSIGFMPLAVQCQ